MNVNRSLFDSHCHLDDGQFDSDREELIQSLPGQGIFACLSCGSDLKSSLSSLELARRYDFVYAAAGIHPHEASKRVEDDLNSIKTLLSEPKVVALGEIGLDFYYDFSPREVQAELLHRQLDLAVEMRKPVVLHVRDAHGAMIDLLNSRQGSLPAGVLHCFSGSAESAVIYQRLGFYISFAGPLTFKTAVSVRQAAKAVSPERFLIETDSPYLAPVPFRGKRNDPAKVAEVCRAAAEVFGIGMEEMADISRRNACELFGIAFPGAAGLQTR